ncbi:MAG: hypothetical protein LBS11_10165 [Oscillospiraceae bacterium]|jgi:predicted dehydrogenase|nr:hypothetical protein [Oscillospiraceae bacterium]
MRVLFIGTDCIEKWDPYIGDLDCAFLNGFDEDIKANCGADTVLRSCRAFGSLSDALAAHKPSFVVIGVPNTRKNKPGYELAALASGADLYVHKFRLADFADYDRVLESSRVTGREVFMGESYRRAAATRTAASILMESGFGAIETIDWRCSLSIPVSSWESAYASLALEDLAPHHLSALDALTPLNAVEVYAKTQTPAKGLPSRGTVCVLVLTLEGGAVVTHRVDWHAAAWPTDFYGVVDIECADGYVHIDQNELRSGRYDDTAATHRIDGPPADAPGEVLQYLKTGKSGAKPYDIEEFDRVARVLRAAQRSVETGLPIAIQP